MTGAEFARAFHAELVGPLVAQHFPGLRLLAGRLGKGSDVLGLDDATSRDHDWGCRLTLLVDEPDRAVVDPLRHLLDRELPADFRGRPVRFAFSGSPTVMLHVEVATVSDFAFGHLGVRPAESLTAQQWLSLTGQSVLETTAGPVFADGTVEFGALKKLLHWYPEKLDRYVVSTAWRRLSQRFPFVGRTADTGQDLQSRLLAGALVTDLMRLAFLLERRWAPYPKWFEALFDRLPIAETLRPHLIRAVTADTWQSREDGLSAAAEILGARQRDRGLPTPDRVVIPFHDRPYRTINDDLTTAPHDLPEGRGSIEQWVDSTDVLTAAGGRAALCLGDQCAG